MESAVVVGEEERLPLSPLALSSHSRGGWEGIGQSWPTGLVRPWPLRAPAPVFVSSVACPTLGSERGCGCR